MVELLRFQGGAITRRRRFLFLWLCLVLVSGCAANSTTTDPLCPEMKPPLTGTTELNVWAESTRGNCWYAQAALTAVQRLPEQDRPIIRLTRDEMIETIANANLSELFMTGDGPDLAQATGQQLISWHEAGYLTPLNDCIEGHNEFTAVRKNLWPFVTIDDQIWAVPFDIDLTMLVYNKDMLRQLNWSEEEISSLPYRVEQGDFLLSDLLETAQTAVAKGVTEPGFGYWPHSNRHLDFEVEYLAFGGRFSTEYEAIYLVNPAILLDMFIFHQQLGVAGVMPATFVGNATNDWSSRLVRRDAVASGRVLFWQIDSDELARLWHDFPDVPFLFQEEFGVTPFPSAIINHSGSTVLRFSLFVIPAKLVTGRTRQADACHLLARMIDRDISAQHSMTSFNVGAVTGLMNEPVFAQHPLLPDMEAWVDDGHTVPNSAAYNRLRDILTAYMLQVERGEMEPALAVETAVTELKEQLGDQLVIEQ